MKKVFIKVSRAGKSRLVCTGDISKMFYFKSRPIPKVPRYEEDEEVEKHTNAGSECTGELQEEQMCS